MGRRREPADVPSPADEVGGRAGTLRGGDAATVAQALGREVKSALARWVLKKRRDQRDSDPPDPSQEATHRWDGRRRYAEDYTFAGVTRDLGLVVRLEWLPGRDSHRVWIALLRPGQAATLPEDQQMVRATEGDRWRAGGLELDCVEPYRRWSVRYVGRLEEGDADVRCSIDLTFVSETQPHWLGADDDPELVARHLGAAQWDRSLVRGVRRMKAEGYVQPGSLIGTVAFGDTLIPVRASCLRQHSWGVRDWGASDQAYQCYFEDAAGRSGFVHHAQFPFVTLEGGFVVDEQGRQPIRMIGASLERRPDRAPAQATLHLHHAHGGLDVELESVGDTSLVVDGRGRLDFALCRAADGGHALWVQQTRVLPRRQPH